MQAGSQDFQNNTIGGAGVEIRNPNIEIRNKFKIQMTEVSDFLL